MDAKPQPQQPPAGHGAGDGVGDEGGNPRIAATSLTSFMLLLCFVVAPSPILVVHVVTVPVVVAGAVADGAGSALLFVFFDLGDGILPTSKHFTLGSHIVTLYS